MATIKAGYSGRLLDILKTGLPGWKVTTLKQRLKAGLISVNGKAARSGAAPVGKDDTIEIHDRPIGSRVVFPSHLGEPPLEILYADADIIAVDKPSGLLSVATPRERNLTAIRLMREWLAELNSDSRDNLHAAHRLDRDASGILLLARSLPIRKKLVSQWKEFTKTYLALVDGEPAEPVGKIDVPLWEDKGLFVRTAEKGGGVEALTFYKTLRSNGKRSLLEVTLGTGRKHQIRAHLASIGCPIVGDLRYGTSKASRLALHAARLEILHPTTGEKLLISSKTPKFFNNAVKK